MDIVPIPLYTINLILQYICPPSQLVTPIPSDLLSLSLLQRHRLLDITLNRHIFLSHLAIPDPEHAYAHVHVKSTGDDGLRLVFEWDGQESWKYHDSNVMPFPPGTHQSLSDAVEGADTITIPVPESKGPKSGNGGDDTDDDDDYWNSYGAEDAHSMQPSPSVGSADSTVPSPVHKTTRKLQAPHEVSHAETLPILTADIRSRLRDPKAPPSPNTLSCRLTALSPRAVITSPLSVGFSEPGPEDDIPDATDDDTESPSVIGWGRSRRSTKSTNLSSRQGVDQDDDGLAVQDAVRGLFCLWKTTRRGSTPERTGESSLDEHDRADFLQLVGRAIAVPR
ncbi:hypothetical protein EDB89DRAFT_1946869 [Lactarius sanguifluus]|nr:hypothetical protein EDB89DRAFT_1946869 [Lactarius sanguifluus]